MKPTKPMTETVLVENDDLEEGVTPYTELQLAGDEPIVVSDEEARELREAYESVERGEGISARALLAKWKRTRA